MRKVAEWGVYLLTCADGTIYCGITKEFYRRVEQHNKGTAAKYTRGRRPVKVLMWTTPIFTHGDALRAERYIKSRSKHRKYVALYGLMTRQLQKIRSSK